MKKFLSVILAAIVLLALVGCGEKSAEPVDGWVCAWGSALQKTDSEKQPSLELNENTFRTVVMPALGGEKLRLTFSNALGTIPLQIEEVRIAKLANIGSSEILPETDTAVTFEGKTKINIENGLEAVTDEISLSFNAYEPLAVTVKFGKYIGGGAYGHTFNYSTAWVAPGNQVSSTVLENAEVTNCCFYLTRCDVWAEAGTECIVAFGDSITDGIGATVDKYSRWPDVLNSLNAQNGAGNVSVVNMGIGGQMLTGSNPANNRAERDILQVSGVKKCVILLGTNDIGLAKTDNSQEIIDALNEISSLCRAAGIKVYVGTVMPMKNHDYYTAEHEKIRQTVNEYIRTKGDFDGVIDFDNLFKDPADPEKMREEYNSPWKDYLHPGDEGYKAMAELVYSEIF